MHIYICYVYIIHYCTYMMHTYYFLRLGDQMLDTLQTALQRLFSWAIDYFSPTDWKNTMVSCLERQINRSG